MNTALFTAFTNIKLDFYKRCNFNLMLDTKIDYEVKNGIIYINTLINEQIDCLLSVNYYIKSKVRLANEGVKSRINLNKFIDLLPKLFVEEAFLGEYGSFNKKEFEVADILVQFKYQ